MGYDVPKCPECKTKDDVEFVTVCFEQWELDDKGNVGECTNTINDPSGDWAHFYCNTCDIPYGFTRTLVDIVSKDKFKRLKKRVLDYLSSIRGRGVGSIVRTIETNVEEFFENAR